MRKIGSIPDTDEGNLRLYYELGILEANPNLMKKHLDRYVEILDTLAKRGLKIEPLDIDAIQKPFGPWASHTDCVNHMMREQNYSEERAHRICQALEQRLGRKR